jgi:hypothetical protein
MASVAFVVLSGFPISAVRLGHSPTGVPACIPASVCPNFTGTPLLGKDKARLAGSTVSNVHRGASPSAPYPSSNQSCANGPFNGVDAGANPPIRTAPNSSGYGDVNFPIHFSVIGDPVGVPAVYCWYFIYAFTQYQLLGEANGSQVNFSFPVIAYAAGAEYIYVDFQAT